MSVLWRTPLKTPPITIRGKPATLRDCTSVCVLCYITPLLLSWESIGSILPVDIILQSQVVHSNKPCVVHTV